MTDDFEARYAAVVRDWGIPVRMRRVPGRRADTRVLEAGPANAPVVLCLAGGGDTAAVWFGQADALARTRRVLAPDLPGDAGRTTVRDLRSAADLTAWVVEVLDHLAGAAPVQVIAHSYGARIAVALALAEPERVDRLVLLDPTSVFAGIRPRTAARAVPLLLAPSGPRLSAFKRWETGGHWPPTQAFGQLAAAAADGPRPRPVVPRRPSARRMEGLRTLPGGVEVLLAERSRYHDAARVADRIRDRHPWIHVRSLPVAHHELPFAYRP